MCAFALISVACSNSSQDEKEEAITDDFKYTVNDDGNINFTYTLHVFNKPPEKLKKTVDRNGRVRQERREFDKDWVDTDNLAVRRLDKILDEKEICPNSLTIDSKRQTPYGYRLEGVCN